MPNLKVIELASPWSGVDGNFAESALPFARRSAAMEPARAPPAFPQSDQPHSAIGQIPHKACNFKSRGQTPGQLRESRDPLDMAAVKACRLSIDAGLPSGRWAIGWP